MLSSENEILKKIIVVLGDSGREAFNSIIDNEVEEALAYERKHEIKRATKALYEAKVKEDVIIQLLHDYWKIDEYQAREVLRIERTVNAPKKVLITYLQSKGYKTSYIKEFVRNNNVEKQLESDSSLWKLSNSPEKLMKAIQENNKHIV
ncbi:hypothetical protein [Clostridium beijerinckii]|uniref:hypothetical protein n=1 Tax=Clostridium beijerinckii TaxID=1520 RepID=UPI00156F32C3|nr:hypothetical protein [Clostridium beijerinckii]NRT75151.1 hypothetical protein [Clostridium beijerinckii]